mgnify:CR=1 FL=1
MNQEEAGAKIKQLSTELKRHNYNYYVLSEATISDQNSKLNQYISTSITNC